MEYRPVFTAHPTEASRRSVLELLRRIADAGAGAARTRAARAADAPRAERRMAELVDMLWQTDELRVAQPEPKDEARTAIYYLQSLAAAGRARPARGARPHAGPHRRRAAAPAPGRCASAPGPAATATATPTSPPRSPSTCSRLQHDFGLRVLVERGRGAAQRDAAPPPGSSRSATRCARASSADAAALPITYATIRRLNAEEPYRLKLSFVRVRLQRTRDRLADGTAARAGPRLPRLRRAARRPVPGARLDAGRRRRAHRRRRRSCG